MYRITSQLLGGWWRCKPMPHLYIMVVSCYTSHGQSCYNSIYLETLEKRSGQHTGKFAWVEATNRIWSILQPSKTTAFGSGKLCHELCNFQSLGTRKEHSSLPFSSRTLNLRFEEIGSSPDGPSAAASWCLPCRLPETCLNSFEKSIWRLTWRIFLCLFFCAWRFLQHL